MPNPKLEYDARTPAFIQKLKGQYVAANGRHNVQFARPKKQLIDADDDAPTYVDEASHEPISKEDYEKLSQGPSEETPEQLDIREEQFPTGPSTNNNASKPTKTPQASFGSSNKRKAGKVLGADDGQDEPATDAVKPDANSLASETRVKKPLTKAKKAKKIKLSFDES